MPRVTILADDLTGAADCGIAFRVAGLATAVALDAERVLAGADVLAVDLDTRHRSPTDAAERSFRAAAAAWRAGCRVLYRKIDSTLRGNVGVELAATARAVAASGATPAPLVVVAPAFPATGRVTRGGAVIVEGVPLAETEIWRCSGSSGPADLPSLVEASGLRATVLARDTAGRGSAALAAALRDAAARGLGAVVCDAESDADLRLIAEAGAALATPVIWCGSGGLARQLPAVLRLAAAVPPARLPPARGTSIAVVSGTRSPLGREQARRLGAEPGVDTIEVAAEALLLGGDQAAAAAETLRRALEAGKDVLVLIRFDRILERGRGLEIAAALGRLVAAEAAALRGVVATGGDVARAILDAIGARGLHLVGEVEPGVPLGVTDGEPALPMVTKAGAFGGVDTLRRCRAALRQAG